jgi:hypothetical protein
VLRNGTLVGAVLVAVGPQGVVLHWSPLQTIFGTLPLDLADLLPSTTVFWAVEIGKCAPWRRGSRAAASAP